MHIRRSLLVLAAGTLLLGAACAVVVIAGLRSAADILAPAMLALAITILVHPLRVALLEAGPKITQADYSEHKMSWQLPYLGSSPKVIQDRPIQGRCYACTEYNYKWFVNDVENPYVQDKPFMWIRQRVLGGRNDHVDDRFP